MAQFVELVNFLLSREYTNPLRLTRIVADLTRKMKLRVVSKLV